MKTLGILYLIVLMAAGCQNTQPSLVMESKSSAPVLETSLIILGTVQDAGSPHIACKKECCSALFENPDSLRRVVSLGLIDPENDKTFLFEATPDITSQLKILKQFSNSEEELPDGIFLTHAHIGHYTGLIYLGKEATNAVKIPVYAMPRMKTFLEENGPWSQLVTTANIVLQPLENKKEVALTSNLHVIPFTVPHRDEFSETVGYTILGPHKSALFIPDIDKWQKWEVSIIAAIEQVDYAFLDATFYNGAEINTRDISQIPHPFIIESMELFKDLPLSEKQKIHFIHFNHTNPALNSESDAYKTIIKSGFNIAKTNDLIQL
mgnify:CR=1 FL=1